MLSKSQARLFFIGGTIFFSTIFILLTVDTVANIDPRQHTENLTKSVIHGKQIWEAENCMGCHTILGEGAYYAPELTKVVDRRGKEWISVFLRDPEAMFPGQRRMVKYDFSDQDIEDVIAFLAWIGEIDTNGFPPEPDLMPATTITSVAATSASEPPAYFNNVCVACHAFQGNGGNVGPALDSVGQRYTRNELDLWLADPPSVKPGTAMPNLNLSDATRTELVEWLLTLK